MYTRKECGSLIGFKRWNPKTECVVTNLCICYYMQSYIAAWSTFITLSSRCIHRLCVQGLRPTQERLSRGIRGEWIRFGRQNPRVGPGSAPAFQQSSAPHSSPGPCDSGRVQQTKWWPHRLRFSWQIPAQQGQMWVDRTFSCSRNTKRKHATVGKASNISNPQRDFFYLPNSLTHLGKLWQWMARYKMINGNVTPFLNTSKRRSKGDVRVKFHAL